MSQWLLIAGLLVCVASIKACIPDRTGPLDDMASVARMVRNLV